MRDWTAFHSVCPYRHDDATIFTTLRLLSQDCHHHCICYDHLSLGYLAALYASSSFLLCSFAVCFPDTRKQYVLTVSFRKRHVLHATYIYLMKRTGHETISVFIFRGAKSSLVFLFPPNLVFCFCRFLQVLHQVFLALGKPGVGSLGRPGIPLSWILGGPCPSCFPFPECDFNHIPMYFAF